MEELVMVALCRAVQQGLCFVECRAGQYHRFNPAVLGSTITIRGLGAGHPAKKTRREPPRCCSAW